MGQLEKRQLDESNSCPVQAEEDALTGAGPRSSQRELFNQRSLSSVLMRPLCFMLSFFYSFVCLSQDRASERYRSQQREKNELKYHLENGRIIEAPTELVQPVTQSRPKQLLPWHAWWPKSVDKLPRPTVKQQREKGRSFATFTDGRSQSIFPRVDFSSGEGVAYRT